MYRPVSRKGYDAAGTKKTIPPPAEKRGRKQYTFEDAARFVCEGKEPPPGLAPFFNLIVRPLELFPYAPPPPRMTRQEMVEALNNIKAAGDVILGGLTGPPASFIMAEKYPLFDRIALINLLIDLKRRCHDGVSTLPLAGSGGRVKPGPGDVAEPDDLSLADKCAGSVLITWREIHGKLPSSRNRHACGAAEALFQLATDPDQGSSPKAAKSNRGENVSAIWRRPFDKMRARNPILGAAHDIVVCYLRSALATEPSSEEGAQTEAGPAPEVKSQENITPEEIREVEMVVSYWLSEHLSLIRDGALPETRELALGLRSIFCKRESLLKKYKNDSEISP